MFRMKSVSKKQRNQQVIYKDLCIHLDVSHVGIDSYRRSSLLNIYHRQERYGGYSTVLYDDIPLRVLYIHMGALTPMQGSPLKDFYLLERLLLSAWFQNPAILRSNSIQKGFPVPFVGSR